MDNEQVLITYSMMRMFCECKKLFKYRYVDELVPATRDKNLFFGSIIHTCLEKYYSLDSEESKEEIDAYITDIYAGNTNLEDIFCHSVEAIRAHAMMAAYRREYQNELKDLKIVDLEKPFVGNIAKDVFLAGKIDGIVERDGSYLIFEHKTTSMLSSSYKDRLDNDFQILVYSYCAKELLGLDKPITGVLYNILSKSRLKKKKNEDKNQYFNRIGEQYIKNTMFARKLININETKMKTVLLDMDMISRNILKTLETRDFYRNNSHCYRWNKPCQYYTLCYCAEKDKESIKTKLFNKTKPYVELEGDLTIDNYLLPSGIVPGHRERHKINKLAELVFN